jgi:dihydrofolate reductase
MPELMIDFITSLDGYGAAEGWPGWWGLEGPEYLAWLGDQPEATYTILMGANTYRLVSEPATDGEPGTDALAGLSKIVFSTTLKEPLSWPNTQLVNRDPVEAVREIKETGTKPMRTLGSLTLCRSLINAGLVDRFRVVVFPVITVSSGRDRIYDGYPDLSLDMIGSRTPSTAGCSSSSTGPPFWPGHPASATRTLRCRPRRRARWPRWRSD